MKDWQQAEIHEILSICCYHGFADGTVSKIFREIEMCIDASKPVFVVAKTSLFSYGD